VLAAAPAFASVTLTASGNPVTFGQPETLTAALTPSTATGSVTFYDAGLVLGVAPVSNGSARFTTVLLGAGVHSITARYDGDPANVASVSSALALTVKTVPSPDFRSIPATYGTNPLIADFNGDGKVDFAAVTSAGLQVFFGNGDGTFQAGPVLSIPLGTVMVGDFNDDGLPDIAVSSYGIYSSFTFSVFLNNAGASFTQAVGYTGASASYSAPALGDFNNDGKLDLAITTPDGLEIIPGNGDGSFGTPISRTYMIFAPANVGVLLTGDFNNDGNADLFIQTITTSLIVLGNGDGTLQDAEPLTLAFTPFLGSLTGIVTADFNGDGKLDVAAALNLDNDNAQLAIYLGNGDGTMRNPEIVPLVVPLGTGTDDLVVSDFNGDGKLDLSVGLYNAGMQIVLGNGDGTFGTQVQYPAFAGAVGAADFNGDGRPDLLLASTQVLLGVEASQESLTTSSSSIAAGATVTLTAGVQPSTATGTVSFYDGGRLLGTATVAGGSAALTTSGLDAGTQAITAVYSGDAETLPFTSSVSTVTVNGTPTALTVSGAPTTTSIGQPVTLTAAITPAASSGSVTFFDFTTLLASVPIAGTSASVTTSQLAPGPHSITARYSGNTTLEPSAAAAVPLSVNTLLTSAILTGTNVYNYGSLIPVAFASADFNGDGKTDVAAALSNEIVVLLGNGDGTTQAGQVAFTGTSNVTALVAADVNADGKPDLVFVQGASVSVLLGNGNGTFGSPLTMTLTDPASLIVPAISAIALGDFNGDGLPDLALPTPVGVFVYLGGGDGTFRQSSMIPGYTSAVNADFNGDGLADLAIGGSDVEIYLSNGDGTFRAGGPVNSQPAGPLNPVLTADFNNDGKIDIAATVPYPNGFGSLSTVILLGNGDGTFSAVPQASLGVQPLQVADYNGDGIPDILATEFGGQNSFLFGNGDGTFQLQYGNYQGVPLISGNFYNNGRPSFVGVGGVSTSQGAIGMISVLPGGESSAVQVTPSASTLNYGQTLTLTATVTPSTVTGTVTFTAIANLTGKYTSLGTLPVTAGSAVLSINNLPNGTYTVNATYSGDSIALASSSSLIPITIDGFATTTQFTTSGTAATIGQVLTLTGTVSPGTVGGTVAFFDGAVQIASAAVTNGVATAAVAFEEPGTHALSAIYTGDAGDLTSVSAVASVSVTSGVSTGLTAPSAVPTQGPTLSVLSADFNRDGKPDLAAGDASGVNVFLGNGDGTFRAAGYVPVPNGATSPLMAADLNLDGNLDLIVSGAIFFGNGDGTFQAQATGDFVGVGPPTLFIDVNGDGRVDSVYPGLSFDFCLFCYPPPPPTYSGVAGEFGNGDGTFRSGIGGGQDAYYTLFAGDFNGDGKVDLVGSGNGTVGVLIGNGAGGFTESTIDVNMTVTAVGDFNGDGKLDVFGSIAGQPSVLLGNGDGTFAPPVTSASTIAGTVMTGDFNGDGKLDVLTVDANSPAPISVLFGNGNGTFQPPQQYPTAPSFVAGPYAAADFNGDGKIDLAVADSQHSDVQILLGTAATTVTLSSSANPVSAGAQVTLTATVAPATTAGSISFTDGSTVLGSASLVNGVATLPVSFATTGDHFLTAKYNGAAVSAAGVSGTLTLSVTSTNATATTLSVSPNPAAVGQVVTLTAAVPGATSGQVTFTDGAQVLGEAVVANGTASFATVLLGAGIHALKAAFNSGSDAPSTSALVSLNVTEPGATAAFPLTGTLANVTPASIASGDFNGDGKADVAIGDSNGNVQVLLAVGNGEFSPQPVSLGNLSAPNTLSAIVSGDFNGDGAMDLAVVGTFDNEVVVYLGDGHGQLQAGVHYSTGSIGPTGLVAADLNRDGKLDLTVAGSGGIAVLLGNGDGSFAAPSLLATAGPATVLVVGDFNADGISDLADVISSGVEVRLGNGDGTFAAGMLIPVAGAESIAALNSDLAVSTSAGLVVIPGSSNGMFGTPITYNSAGLTGPLIVADLSGDGILDVAAAAPESVVVFYGSGDGSLRPAVVQPLMATPLGLCGGDFSNNGETDLAIASSQSGPVVTTLVLTPQPFTDVPSTSFAFGAVTLLADMAITTGCNSTDFCPNDDVTRAQAAVFLVRAILGTGTFTYSKTPYFTDVPAASFGFAYVQKLFELGLTTGCGGGDFCPDDSVTRAEAAVFIMEGRYGASNPFPYSPYASFFDVQPGAFAFGDIQRMAQDGITTGCAPSVFCPDDPVTREEMAVFIERGLFNMLLPTAVPTITSVSGGAVMPGQTGSITFSTAGASLPFTVTNVGGVTFGAVQQIATDQWSVSYAVSAGAAAIPEPLWIENDGGVLAILPNAIVVQ
jgi:hypothetical protein